MTRSGLRTAVAPAAFLLLAAAAPAPAPGPPPRVSPETVEPASTEDRVFALVQAGNCGQARVAAEQAGDKNLADQIGLMCGHSPSAATSPKGGGEGRRGTGGQGGGSGRRGGG